MKELIKNLKMAWIYAKDQKWKLVLYILFNIIGIGISVVVPILSANIIVSLTNNSLKQVLLISLVILLVEISRNIVHFFTRYFSQVIYRETFTKIQYNLGKEILKIENKCIDSNSSGVFIQRLTNDTSKIADIFNVLSDYIAGIITNIGIFGAVFIIDKICFIYILIMVIILYIVEHNRVKKYNEKDKIYRKKNEKVSGFVGELVRGIRDIKMLNAENSFMRELKEKVVDLNKQRYSMGKTNRNYSLLRDCLLDIFDAGLIFLLVFLIYKQELIIASALIVYNYMNRVSSIVHYVGRLIEEVKNFNLSSTRIFDIINGVDFPKEQFGTKHLDIVEGNFEFKNVTFSYETDEKVLDNISFKVNANETVAFVGKSGAGKSTIFSLLCKMYEVDKGTIEIDGVDIKKLDKDTIRGNITIISQSPYIFNLSIRDNLRLVKEDLTEEEMINACKLAYLHDFIEQLPEGYDTIVGEGGINLSGGQRQRLAIARAFVQKTEIILFDEATSALDNEAQYQIQKAIENLQKDYTILLIAHRLSTIINSDRILFLDGGKIIAQGTHDELLNNSPEYQQLYDAEMSNN